VVRRSHWCDRAPPEDKGDDTKDSFSVQLQPVFDV
jgi:hypothetical protein